MLLYLYILYNNNNNNNNKYIYPTQHNTTLPSGAGKRPFKRWQNKEVSSLPTHPMCD